MLGKEYCKLDGNGRFKFPIALKRQLETGDCRFVIRQSIYAKCLELWPYSEFEAEMEQLKQKLNPYSIEGRKLLRRLNEVNKLELDASDRLLIPNEQRDCIKNAKELVLLPYDRFIEVWDRDIFSSKEEDDTNFAALADQLLGHQENEGA